MICNFYKPIPALAEIVERYWYLKMDATNAALQHYATPMMQCLAFNFYAGQDFQATSNKVIKLDKPFYFFGQQTSARFMGSNEKRVHALGVKFKPLGITKLTGINMQYMANNIIGADDVWGREVESLGDEVQSAGSDKRAIDVLEMFLLKKFVQNKLHDRINRVDHALSLIERSHGAINICDLQHESNTSKKTLERAFMNYLGINPKLYSRIIRFNAAKKWIDKSFKNQNFSRLAYNLDYCDGAHFSAEFKRFSDMTPTEYLQNLHIQTIPEI